MNRPIMLLLTVLLAGMVALVPASSGAQSAQQRDLIIASAVQVLAMDWRAQQPVSTGSGTLITRTGLILTNFHVISDETGNIASDGIFPIGINVKGADGPPEFLFLAEVSNANPDWDLALLQVTKNIDGSPVASDTSFPFLEIGDSDQVQIEDTIRVVGFPGLGGATVTLTRGVVAGFETDPQVGRTMIKTDTEISPGNSGGTAVDANGMLIGVPTAIMVNQTGKIGQVRPINIAKQLFGTPIGSTEGGVPPTNNGTTTTNADATVQVEGEILSSDTGEPISGALIGVLEPGLTYEEWDGTKNGIYTYAQTDREGKFTLSELVVPNQGYTVILEADGYQQAYQDNFVLADSTDGASVYWSFKLSQAR